MNDKRTDDAHQISVAIITLNEEENLARCLASLPVGCEVVVLDSGSTDKTKDIALAYGAKFSTRIFDDHASQKNAALALTTRPWILSLDADETLDETLREAILGASRTQDQSIGGFRITRGLVFMERRLRYGKAIDRPLRFFRRDSGAFESAIHESFQLKNGRVGGVLAGFAEHRSYRNLEDYFLRFNSYTTKVAQKHLATNKARPAKILLVSRFWFEFIARYIVRGGFLDGYAGYVYALVSSMYAFVKYAKLREHIDRV